MQTKKKLLGGVVVLLAVSFLVVTIQPVVTARLVLNKDFSPSTVTYTNKTMHFEAVDPYDGYFNWAYEEGDSVQGVSDGQYVVDTEDNGDAYYFGFDEFVEHGVVSANVIWKTTLLSGTYHFQPLGYFYQKTALNSTTHWALAIDWDSTGIDLVYNSGNGGTPTVVNLVATAPSIGTYYKCILSNLGDQTFVSIQDISWYPTYPVLYSGYVTTENYDATSLYAGFGQYSSGDGHMYGKSDNFTIVDSAYTYPDDGIGFDTIDAYLDEVFTQTLYDMELEMDPTLEVDPSVTNITLLVGCWLNSTTFGISTIAEGKNIIRLNITVTQTNSTIVFSQNNLTYISGSDYGASVFLYQYSVYLDFVIQMGELYTVNVTYEIYGVWD